MEVSLKSDIALGHCFNHYLSFPIFPVHLFYDAASQVCKVLPSSECRNKVILLEGNTNVNIRLFKWLENHCWPYFLKSRLYCKYRLYCALQGKCPNSAGEELEKSILSPNREPLMTMKSFAEYLRFENNLAGTGGAPLTEVWVSCEGYFMGVKQHWAASKTISSKCDAIPLLQQTRRTGKIERWLLDVQATTLQRLQHYWLPRFCHCTSDDSIQQPHPHAAKCEEEGADIPFIEGLYHNAIAGDPFSDFLQRESRLCYHQLHLWEECQRLVQHLPDDLFLYEGWKLWSRFLAPDGTFHVEVEPALMKELKVALHCRDIDSAISVIREVNVKMYSSLKRLWSKFQRDLYEKYIICLGDVYQQSNNPSSASKTRSLTNNRYRKKKYDPRILLAADLQGGALESLGDLETFLQFEHYLFTVRGPHSVENTYLKLWKSLIRYNKTIQKDARNSLAVVIHKNFISDKCKVFLPLPDELVEVLEPDLPLVRPGTPAMQSLQRWTEQMLGPVIEQFLLKEGQGSLPSVDGKSRLLPHTSKKIISSSQLREDAMHLFKTLSVCEGPMTHKLKSFSEYLAEHVPPSKHVIVNNVQFWLEVSKFKVMYESDTSIRVLFHKGEAMVDRYLDASTPPWIKISIAPELALQLVAVFEELCRSRIAVYLDRLMDLFERAQERVLADMAPYWGSFCKVYRSPLGSAVSLPQVVSCPPVTSRSSLQVSEVSLPPLPRPHHNVVPLLSYSKLKGVRWRGTFHLYDHVTT